MAICAECTYLEINNGNYTGAFWCDRKLERHLATDIACGSFCKAYSRNTTSIKNAVEYSNNHNSSGCYLTTILCSILKLPDDNYYLETMRNFRKEILQKDEKYKPLLVEYDIIGPKIAEALNNDPQKQEFAEKYFNSYISTIIYNIENKKYNNAVIAYERMTNSLKEFYGLDEFSISTLEIENADIEKSGHGKYMQKKIAL